MNNEDTHSLSFAEMSWVRRSAKRKLSCTESGQAINIDDTYYERVINITLYDNKIDLRMGRFLTEKEYFKQKLKGTLDNE